MKINIHTIDRDEVIDSHFLTGITNYRTSLDKLYPLIDRLDIQRNIQSTAFYKRLEIDITNGCIMPPITIAFVDSNDSYRDNTQWEAFIRENIDKGFILDGIQRLNTLKRANDSHQIDMERPLFLNVLICKSKDNLLYRMVTLNNGQKPMSVRHQIEILSKNIYNFENLPLKIISEKEAKNKTNKDFLKTSDVVSSYLAFLSNSINLESKKIIQSKMDELIAKQIIASDITADDIEFSYVLEEVDRLTKNNKDNFDWFKNVNNLIGFSVGIKKSHSRLKDISSDEFNIIVRNFEEAFDNINVSKIRVGTERKKLSRQLIEKIDEYKDYEPNDLLLDFSEIL